MASFPYFQCTALSLPPVASNFQNLSHAHLISFPVHSQSRHSLRVPNLTFSNLKILSCSAKTRAPVVTKVSWERLVLKSETPVLVEFYASWCGPCRMVHRVIDEIAADYAGKVKCFVINTDDDSQIAAEYEIKAVPVVLLFKNGEKCDTVVGTMPKEFYVGAIERVLKS